MSKIRSIVAAQSSVGEPEHRGDERSEAARSGGEVDPILWTAQRPS